ncbi:thioesterase family protein [Azotosporobacter soli]|uniref:thioesterase family protein n=1 Tax=Azotosporobacter soli TaxID=3055040 RepID=UPI0031FEDE8B
MEFSLSAGLTSEKKELVTTLNTAIAYGSGGLSVYATPAMIGLMEGAALSAVDPLLPSGFATVGTRVEINHLAATPIGMTVSANAELVAVEGRKLIFNVTAFDEKEKIGEGRHERFIIDCAKFSAKTTQKISC